MTRELPTPTSADAARMIGDPVGWVTSPLPTANTYRVCDDSAGKHCTECNRCPEDQHCTERDRYPEDHCSECGGCIELGWCTEGCDDSDAQD